MVKVLYFTCVPLGVHTNGGSIVCSQHVQRLAAATNVELHVCGVQTEHAAATALTSRLGLPYHAIRFRSENDADGWSETWRPCRLWPFTLEVSATDFPLVDRDFKAIFEALKPDIVIIDYLLSALFIPSVWSSRCRVITVTLNREADFYRDMRRLGKLPSGCSSSAIAQWRLARFENAVHLASDAVVVLSPNDYPKEKDSRVRTTVIEPVLDDSTNRWQLTSDPQLFYIGNIDHYPNFLAIKWLAEEFAPALRSHSPKARIRVVGASDADVPSPWRKRNIEYLGVSTPEDVTRLFVGGGLFIAPIENTYGSKMKVLQCLSHGTPLMGTVGALSGVRFGNTVPQFSLADPPAAALIATTLLSDKAALARLSRDLSSDNLYLRKSREHCWSDLIVATLDAAPQTRTERFAFILNKMSAMSRRWPAGTELAFSDDIHIAVAGFHDFERSGATRLRWTSGRAEITVKLLGTPVPRRLKVCLWPHPAEADFRVYANGSEVLCGNIAKRAYNGIAILPQLVRGSDLTIRFESSVLRAASDPRELGVPLRSLVLEA